MIEVKIHNQDGQEVGTMQVDEAKLGGEVRPALLKQAFVMYHANQRQGTVRTKSRAEVEGSTRKMFRQKGTGNARTGGIRNPIKKGGGHAKQKLPKDWRQDMPKKARRLARNSALLAKFQVGDVIVLDQIALAEPKTKLMAGVCRALGLDRRTVFALAADDASVLRASRNLPGLQTTTVAQLNAFDLLNNRKLLLTKEGLEAILA
ncbi:MAG: 50S ribosomal protein L4 [Phycisphaerae bacterium]